MRLQNIYDSVPEAVMRKVDKVIAGDNTFFDDNPYVEVYAAFEHMNRMEIHRLKNSQLSELARYKRLRAMANCGFSGERYGASLSNIRNRW